MARWRPDVLTGALPSMRNSLVLVLVATAAFGQQAHPSGKRMTPPTVASVTPLGAARGTTVEVVVEGFNLAGATGVYFSEKGLTGRVLRVKELPDLPDVRIGSGGLPSTVDLGPLPARNQVVIEVDIDAEAPVGPVAFRVLTPLGTSPAGTLLVEPYYGESPDREPNDSLDNAFETYLPTVLAGAIAKAGDVDHYQIKVRAGEELVFDNGGAMLGSALTPVVAILAADGTVLQEYGKDGGRSAQTFAHKFAAAGVHYVRVTDYLQTGGARHFYRIKVGQFPVVSMVYPLGVRDGEPRKMQVRGFGLGASEVTVKGVREADDTASVRPETANGAAFNVVKLAVSGDAEVEASGRNVSTATAQVLTAWPVAVNGWLEQDHYFRFAARKGQALVLEVQAQRFGSDVDSVLEVLDGQGKPVEQAVLRPVWETTATLRDHDSVSRGIRVQSWNALKVGDWVQVGGEVIRVEAMPKGPDSDMNFDGFGGQRMAYFGTTPEAHANDTPVYKVQVLAAGAKPTPNGMPVTRLTYRNDDGGPGFGKDAYLQFTAPADGDYFVRVGEASGLRFARAGEKSGAYRLSVRAPRPDFRLAVNPKNPNVPRGGAIPVTVTALRLDGFAGEIAVGVEGLPRGFTALPATIGAGQVSTTLLIAAGADAALEQAVEWKAVGRAGGVSRAASSEEKLKLVALGPGADVTMTSETKVVELEAGGTAEIAVKIVRRNGFGGRVPVQVMNLPARVNVADVGLNGVLLNENETQRTFTLEALPNAEAVEQWIYVGGLVETRSSQQNIHAAGQAIRLRVKARRAAE